MPQSTTRSIGLDVHKDAIAGADAPQDDGAAVVSLGAVGTRQCDRDTRMRQRHAKATHRVFVSAAGPCGSWLSRSVTKHGEACWVGAPARMPTKAGARVKTDRREALQLARLMRAGALPPVSVPNGADDAMRALPRAREEAISDGTDATCRRTACLLRHDIRSTGQATWHPAHRRWRSAVGCPPPAPPLVLPASVRAVTEHPARLPRLKHARQEQGKSWRFPPVGDALQARRGVPCPVAVTTGAARGDLTRFAPPRPRLASLGLPPAASSSGERRRQGAITTAGTTPARRALGEGAWASRSPAQVRRPLPLRRAKHPTASQDIRWTAQGRLGKRSRTLLARGTHANHVVGAMARELGGGMGAMANQGPVTPSLLHAKQENATAA
jgi:transposase